MSVKQLSSTALYVVSRHPRGDTRAREMVRFRSELDKVVMVAPGEARHNAEMITTHSLPNPTGVLRYLGLNKLKRSLDQYLYFPSFHMLFVVAVRRRLLRAIRRDIQDGKNVCLLVTVPPHTLSLIGYYVKRRIPEVRLIIDWQDLWTYDEAYFNQVPSLYRRRLQRLEKHIMETADVNLTSNPNAQAVLVNHFGIHRSQTAFIHHHFRYSDFEGIAERAPAPRGNRVVEIGFLGHLFKPPKVPGEAVLDAIEHAATSLAASGIRLEFHLFGDRTKFAARKVASMRNGVVTMHPSAPHREALKNIAQCDFLLIALADLPNCKAIMHGKLPHYLFLNRPILALVPKDSFVAEVIRTTKTGYVIPSDSDWSAEIERLLRAHLDGELCMRRRDEAIANYSWDATSHQWLDLIAGTAEEPATGSNSNP